MILSMYIQNCRWYSPLSYKKRFREVEKIINKYSPDIVCLQELIFYRYIKYFKRAGYHAHYQKGRIFTQGGLLTLTKKYVGTSSFHKFNRQGRFFSYQFWDRLINKGVLKTCFNLKGKTFNIYNIHLLARHGDHKGQDKHQTEQLHKILREYHPKDINFLAGDFNFFRNSDNYKRLARRFTDLTPNIGVTHKGEDAQLDYIWSNYPKVEVLRLEKVCLPRWVTDHAGIYMELYLDI